MEGKMNFEERVKKEINNLKKYYSQISEDCGYPGSKATITDKVIDRANKIAAVVVHNKAGDVFIGPLGDVKTEEYRLFFIDVYDTIYVTTSQVETEHANAIRHEGVNSVIKILHLNTKEIKTQFCAYIPNTGLDVNDRKKLIFEDPDAILEFRLVYELARYKSRSVNGQYYNRSSLIKTQNKKL